MKVIIHTFDLQLKHTFRISRYSYAIQPTLIIELQSDGYAGFGEATSNKYYNVSVNSMKKNIEAILPFIENSSNETPEEFWRKAYSLLHHDLFALSALDIAYTDWFVRKKRKKLYEFWGYSIGNNPKTDYTIGIDTVQNMATKMKELPWPIYKIKLGTKDDIAIVTELRKHTEAVFRIDANGGWTVSETLNNAIALKKLGVEFLEQPLKADDWEGHREVYNKSVLPIIADESCIIEEDVRRCENYFHGINIKLSKCGGLTPARRMIATAKELGLKTMVGCMTESTIGISAIAHLLPELDFVDMDGALLLANDIANGVTISDGIITYSDLSGIGTELKID
jgi:L-Ala-D/L-Glu epimerase